MNKRVLGILSMALLMFAFMFSAMTPSGYCMGDNIIRALGFKAWSMESAKHSTNGFHYTILISFAFAILGYASAKHYLKDYPKLVKKLPIILIILFLTSSPLFTWGYGVFLSFSEGVNAVDYIPAQSNCYFTSDPPYDRVSCVYQITLKNHSNNTVKFNMQVQEPPHDSLNMWDVTEINAQGKQTLKEFTLHPEQKKEIGFVMENKENKRSSINGSMRNFNIIIFNKESSRQFKVR